MESTNALSISPVDLFWAAGPVGKLVMALLIAASVWCWFLILESFYGLTRLRRAVRNAGKGRANKLGGIFAAGAEAAHQPIDQETAGERRQRIMEAMMRCARILLVRAEGGLPNLAVIASVAPFVGLFGTVWGIMTAFSGIAEAKDTSLAVVAPGIAEALAATAYGLAAAIPAAFAYNRLVASFTRLGQELSDLVEDHAVGVLRGRNLKEAA
ncbi:MotA/TolQ/ExbB proton channel family protein [Methyloferula stellata]|uniref:MotA/TolQ/ExbB proton channel family protein n=1 Tax=Methyloferula stellata TaxID=876270 RepID=UPI00035EF775|nr:MotA/TolQ/ExbB proton channel family protein [Methyloferula stellata]